MSDKPEENKPHFDYEALDALDELDHIVQHSLNLLLIALEQAKNLLFGNDES